MPSNSKKLKSPEELERHRAAMRKYYYTKGADRRRVMGYKNKPKTEEQKARARHTSRVWKIMHPEAVKKHLQKYEKIHKRKRPSVHRRKRTVYTEIVDDDRQTPGNPPGSPRRIHDKLVWIKTHIVYT